MKKKKAKYTPVARRQDKPDAIQWLVKTCPGITDKQIIKLIGTTISTIDAIRDRTHWNMGNIRSRDPVLLGLCSQVELDKIMKLLNIQPVQAPEYIEENFSETIEYLKVTNLIEEVKSYTQIAKELLSKIKVVKQQSFFDELPSSIFDVVISSEAIECVDNETEFNSVLRNIYSSLKQKGTLIGNILNYNRKTHLTEELIDSKMEGKLNPNETDLQESLLNNLFNDIQIEVIEFPELNNRSKYIYYSGVKNE